MASSKKRLGRGLGGLISGGVNPPAKKAPATKGPAKKTAAPKQSAKKAAKKAEKKRPASVAATSSRAVEGYQNIPVHQVVPNRFQPRREMEDSQIEDLAASIRSEGLLQPIVVRPAPEGYELIAGERRWRAFRLLKQKEIPARVMEASDASSAAIALIENLQREGLNPIEEALGYASLIRDFDLTQEGAAERVGKGRASVANALRLLSLEKDLQAYLSKGHLTVGHAKVLLGLQNADERRLLAKRIIEAGLSVRATEQELQRLQNRPKKKGSSSQTGDGRENTAIASLEKRLMSAWNANVTINHSPKKGRIIIEYQGNDDLQRLLEKLGVEEG